MSEEQNKSALENEQKISEEQNANDAVSDENTVDNETEELDIFADNFSEHSEESNDDSEASDFDTVNDFTENIGENTKLQQTGDLADDQSQYVNTEVQNSTQAKQKKKRILYPSTIVVLVLVVASIVIYALFASSQPSVKGVWVNTNVDDTSTANTYLVLADDNVAYMSLGTMRYMGVYSTSFDDDGQRILTIDIPYALQSSYAYELHGDIMTLTIEGDTTEYTFKNTELPDYTLAVPEDYVRDGNLLGKWKDYTYGIEYTFRADGTMLINEAGVVEADCTYNIVDGTIHVEYLAGEVYSMDMEYTVNGNDLTIGVMKFQKIEDENGNAIQTEEQTTEAETTAEITEEETAAA